MRFSLTQLSSIAWAQIKTAHGGGAHIPDALRDLTSPIESIRLKAYWKLDNYVVLQSDLYEGAYYVIPFLMGFLASDLPQSRELIYRLLYEIYNGYAPDEYTCLTIDGQLKPLTTACRLEIAAELQLFLSDFRNTRRTEVRFAILDLLSILANSAQTILPFLQAELSGDCDPNVRTKIDDIIRELAE